MKVQNIVFDVDGTLFSSEPMLYEIYKDEIIEFNTLNSQKTTLNIPTKQTLIDLIGLPWLNIYNALFPFLSLEKKQKLRNRITQKILNAISHKQGFLFPGVRQTLNQLYRQGYHLFIASNGQFDYIQTILKTYDLLPLFHPIFVLGRCLWIQDKGDILIEYQNKYDLNKNQTLLIGDRDSDLQASKKFGCLFIGCQYGHGKEKEIISFPRIIYALEEVFHYLD